MKEMNYSIIVATYNPNYDKLFETLYSIIMQQECSFEVIIADDGSEKFDITLIEDWMKSNSFENYKIVDNKENNGTVKNIYKALLQANGKYIKLISPGDYLYNNYTLHDAYEYIEKNKFNLIFGKAIYYYLNDSKEIRLINKCNPMNIKPYIQKNKKKIKKSYLIYQDYILGAGLICNKDLLLKYIIEIVDKVKYAEDCSIILMVADDIQINYWNNYIIWYECNSGISTSGSSEWAEKLKEDNKNCFQLIVNKYPKFRKIYNLHYGVYSKLHIIFRIKRKLRKYWLKYKCNKNLSNINFDKVSIDNLKKILEERRKKCK